MIRNCLVRVLLIGMLPIGLSAVAHAADGKDVEYQYNISVELFSIQAGPHGPVKDSYRSLGGGSASAAARLGFSCGDDGFCFMAAIHPVEQDGQLVVNVETTPGAKASQVKPMKERLAMGDLKPVSLDLAKNEQEKRVYKLSITPSVKRIDRTKSRIDAGTLKLNQWHFAQSKVIVDGWRYAGQINASGMSLPFVDITGYARIEFALQPFRRALPLGSMQDGTLTIQKPGGLTPQTVVIDNIKVGCPPMTIPGGLYAVWVRWSPPSKTIAQAAQELASIDLQKSMAGTNLAQAYEKEVRARQQALKENVGELKDADLAPDGIIPQVLGWVRMSFGGGPLKPGDQVK